MLLIPFTKFTEPIIVSLLILAVLSNFRAMKNGWTSTGRRLNVWTKNIGQKKEQRKLNRSLENYY